MKIKKARFLVSAVNEKQYPPDNMDEIALVGRSNVGKSSLINTLVNHKSLAKTSSTPGKTQTINFYEINENFRFVDLPGYGFAKVSKKKMQQWKRMIENYLINRHNLKGIIQLIDIRHKPTQDDKMMYEWLDYHGFAKIIVATKADKISRGKRKQNLSKIEAELQMQKGVPLVAFSARTKDGKNDLLFQIDKLLES